MNSINARYSLNKKCTYLINVANAIDRGKGKASQGKSLGSNTNFKKIECVQNQLFLTILEFISRDFKNG